MDINSLDTITLTLSRSFYEELFESDVEPYDEECDLVPSHLHFIQGMLSARVSEDFSAFQILITQDAREHFLRYVLPESMEMWYTQGTRESKKLIKEASKILNQFGEHCPY